MEYLAVKALFWPPPELDPLADSLAVWAGLGGGGSAIYTAVKAVEEVALLKAGTPEEAAAEKKPDSAPVPVPAQTGDQEAPKA